MALTPAIDIFAFGMCALETAALELTTAGEEGGSKVKVSVVLLSLLRLYPCHYEGCTFIIMKLVPLSS